jgi:hypothetical protein
MLRSFVLIRLTAIDWCVLLFVILGISLVPFASLYATMTGLTVHQVFSVLSDKYPILPILGVGAAISLFAWVFSGKCASSPLWKFCPPFVLLRFDSRFSRETFAFLTAVVTLLGSVGHFLGLTK